MGDVEWTDEAAAAVSRTILLGDGVARDLADYVVEPRTDAVLAALTPHVEAMVREARAEALREAADAWRDEGRGVMFNRSGDDLTPQGRVSKWMRDRAEQVRRGE